VEVLEVRRGVGDRLESVPNAVSITRLRTTVTKDDGTVVLDGEALVWHEPI